MPAILIAKAKEIDSNGSITEIVVWELPAALEPCTHRFKYRLDHGGAGVCRVRYDNELGKGDHWHVNGREEPYRFTTLVQLLASTSGST